MRYTLMLALALLLIYGLFAVIRFRYYAQQAQGLMMQPTNREYILERGGLLRQVAVVGDSTAYGTGGKDETETYHYQFLSQLSGVDSFAVKNYGVVGARVADVAQQLEHVDHVDLLIISIGANDVTHGSDEKKTEEGVGSILKTGLEKAEYVVFVSPGTMADSHVLPKPVHWWWGRGSRCYSELAKRVAGKFDVIHVDVYSHAEASFAQNPGLYFAPDYFHPSAAGYGLWATAILTDIEKTGGLVFE